MKVIKEIIDQQKYCEALEKKFKELFDAQTWVYSPDSMFPGAITLEQKREIVRQKVDKSQFVTIQEYKYLNACIDKDNESALIVCDMNGENIQVIKAHGCKIVEDND